MASRWLAGAAAGAAATMLSLSGCGGGAEKAPPPAPDLLLLVVDGLRADWLDRILEREVVRERLAGDEVRSYARAYAPSSLGVQSLAALFSGRLPTHGGAIGLAEADVAAGATTLAAALRAAGYRTGLVSQASWASRPGIARGFGDLQVAAADRPWTEGEVGERALQVIDDWRRVASPTDQGPSFLVVHWAIPAGAEGQDEASAKASYERFVGGVGEAMAALFEGLAERDTLSEAAVVLTAGHGWELGEHGWTGTGWTLHEEVVRVPLVVGRGAEDLDLGEQTSPLSTVGVWSALQAMAGILEGGAELPEPGARTRGGVISELVVRERAVMRAVVDRDVKYVRILREVPPEDRPVVARGYEELQAAMLDGRVPTPPLFGDPVREVLVRVEPSSLDVTPLELAEHREELSRLRAVLRDYERLCEEEGWAPPEITERLPVDLEDVEQLEVLGYM